MTRPADVAAAARAYLGVRFHHQGRDRKDGLDCAGLVIRVAHDLRLSTFDTRDYEEMPDGLAMREICSEHLLRWPPAVEGAVVLMRFKRSAQHVAIVGETCDRTLTIIHSHKTAGEVVEQRIDNIWRGRILATYRFRGVAYNAAV